MGAATQEAPPGVRFVSVAGAAAAPSWPRLPVVREWLGLVLVPVVWVNGQQSGVGDVVGYLGAHVGGDETGGAEVDAAPHSRVLHLNDGLREAAEAESGNGRVG